MQLVMSEHARRRARERNIPPSRIKRAARTGAPEPHHEKSGCVVRRRDDIVVVVSEASEPALILTAFRV